MSGYTLGSHKPLSQIRIVSSSAHYGRASSHCWITSSLNPLPSTPIQMSKLKSSIGCSYILCACTITSTPAHGMRVFPMSSIATNNPYIDQLATTAFRWGWDSSHWAPWMLHNPWKTPRSTHPLLHQKLTKPPGSLSGSSTSFNGFRIFYRSPMPSTRNTMINTRFHISFRWATKFGCTCRNNALHGPIGSFAHSGMGHTPSPRMWVTIFCAQHSPFPWPAPNLQRGSPSAIFPTIIGHLRDSRVVETNRAQP
jgi:hypothetical protein